VAEYTDDVVYFGHLTVSVVKRIHILSIAGILLLAGVVSFFPGHVAEAAGLVPCGGRGEPVCTLCHLIVGIQGIIAYFMKLMMFLALTIITAMGVLYIVSGGNEGMVKTAKDGLKAALSGVLIVLFAWLVVNVTMFWILPTKTDLGVQAAFRIRDAADIATLGFSFECSTVSTAGTATGTGGGSSGGSSGGGGTGDGTCTPLTSGDCSVENLKTYFGSDTLATQASGICNAESRGSATLPSGVDKCLPGKEVVSFGLFQINISANPVGGLNCPSAFSDMYTGTDKNCTVEDTKLYNECVTAAKDPVKNIQAAVKIQKAGGWGRWGANSKCKY